MADRNFPSSIETALSASSASLAILGFVDWPGGAVRVASWVGTKSWDGHDWLGVGDLISLDKVADSVEQSDIGVQLVVNYLDDDLRNEVITNDPVGSDAALYLALINAATGAVTDAYGIFSGFVDRCEIIDSGENGQLIVRLASELARLTRPRAMLLTDAHQKLLFPGDLGCEYATHMDQPILWGRKPVLPVFTPPPWTPGGPYDVPIDPNPLPPGFSPYPGFNPNQP